MFLQVLIDAAPVAAPSLTLPISALVAGMVVAKDLLTANGIVLLSADHVLTDKLIRLLQLREQRDNVPLVLSIQLEPRQ